MRQSVRRFLTPGWVAFTLLTWAAAVTMVLLGRWQLDVSDRRHFDLQNFSYVIQWWFFSLCALAFWAKAIRDVVRGRVSPGERASGQLVLRRGANGLAQRAETVVGPALLLAPSTDPDQAPVIYRGYVVPQMATSPTASDGDEWHGAYNDYLWQLALADGVTPPTRPIAGPPDGPAAGAPADGTDTAASPAAIE